MEPAPWTPTPANINALPEPVRQYVHDLETRCDPAGDVAALTLLRDREAQLLKAIEEARSLTTLERAFLEAAFDEERTWREVVGASTSKDGGTAWRARLHAALSRSRATYDALLAGRA